MSAYVNYSSLVQCIYDIKFEQKALYDAGKINSKEYGKVLDILIDILQSIRK